MTTVRAISAAQAGKDIQETPPIVTVTELRTLLGRLAPLSLQERHKIPGLPARRADVFPTALATILAVAKAAGLHEFQHSFYNLRWGIAARALTR
jgi:exopolyphosphatase/guanosine-5'-triphosphate,3'-diphosphate pyrophosphatase